MIRPQSRPLQSKIWMAAPEPSMNHVPSGISVETAMPGKAKDDKAYDQRSGASRSTPPICAATDRS
jgi:hypothetical protein